MAAAELFVWDEEKRAANLRKHGADFALVERFDFAGAVIITDDRRDYGETRYRAFGAVGKRLYALVFTRRGDRIRIISLRKANAREIRRYVSTKEKSAGR
jgi:uncharacterized protein